MKAIDAMYGATTSLLALATPFSVYAYLTQPAMWQALGIGLTDLTAARVEGTSRLGVQDTVLAKGLASVTP
ncbi:hypothetical protein [uncultured Hymenobacter sp.]|uniref:hypothetical protein n=1 Tax=uncultured Hymenobacter sp. TaxID=170016 RepID=UPI0035C9521C